ncbi:MAG: hypothetical protein OXC79_05420 [Candidatus Poribacteria bacterium]|nr:hypothetical protein [Candidatus Poribacteria bacterium]
MRFFFTRIRSTLISTSRNSSSCYEQSWGVSKGGEIENATHIPQHFTFLRENLSMQHRHPNPTGQEITVDYGGYGSPEPRLCFPACYELPTPPPPPLYID